MSVKKTLILILSVCFSMPAFAQEKLSDEGGGLFTNFNHIFNA